MRLSRSKMNLRHRISMANRIVLGTASAFLALFVILFLAGNFGPADESKAAHGMHGAKTVSALNTILNEYTRLSSNASAGAMSITVTNSSLNGNSRFSGSLSAGELVMIIQMQGATISTSDNSSYGSITSYNNCGRFEFAEVSSVPNGTTINLSIGLKYSYTASGAVQVIRVPRYSSFTINSGASVTCPSWDGTTGGIVAVESNGNTTINGTIEVSGKGFRGGTTEQNTTTPGNHTTYRSTNNKDGAEKGESIAGLASSLANGQYGRGAPANGGGGGNSHNGGGGGGSNGGSGTWNGGGNPDNSGSNWNTAWNLEGGSFSANISSGGGRGGYTWSNATLNPITTAPGNASWTGDNRFVMGGLGGRILDYTGGRIFMGGGGGAGDSNNNVGTAGGNGGGIVYLLSGGTVDGSGTINANGADVPLSSSAINVPGDACGGGGGGGTIIIYTDGSQVKNITLNANGGTGGSQNLNNGSEAEGPGGGGGGGYISTTNASGMTRNANRGANGTTNAPPMVNFIPNGATNGAAGTVTTSPANPYSGTSVLPIQLVSFSAMPVSDYVKLEWVTSSEINNNHFTIERSSDGISFTAIAQIPGAGNSSVMNEYSVNDKQPLNGRNYYRLSQTDYDGTTRKFNTVVINYALASDDSFRIYSASPVPFSDKLNIIFSSEEKFAAHLVLVSSMGKQEKRFLVSAIEGYNTVEWSGLSELIPGVYLLYASSGYKKTKGIKVIKK